VADDRDGPPQAWWASPPSTAAVERPAPRRPAHPAAEWSRTPDRPAHHRHAAPRGGSGRSPQRAPFGDQRGLTAAGASLLVLLLGGLGAGVDVATGTGLRTVFAVAFAVAAALAAATVHPEDLLASVVLVPLAYAVIGIVAGIAEGSSLHTASKLVLAVANITVTSAPALLIATAAAAVIAAARGYAVRRRPGRSTLRGTPT
jgi:hypothetical protein